MTDLRVRVTLHDPIFSGATLETWATMFQIFSRFQKLATCYRNEMSSCNHNITFTLLCLTFSMWTWQHQKLVYTTRVNSAFRALWLVNSEVISEYYSPPINRRGRFLNFRPLVTHKITFWSANYSACVVYTKTIIHLCVGESDGYLPLQYPSLFTSTSANNCELCVIVSCTATLLSQRDSILRKE